MLQRPVTLGCGASGGCGCGCGGSRGGGMAGFSGPTRYPTVAAVLRNYIAAKQAANEYFYISPQLNLSAIPSGGLGEITLTPDGSASVSNAIDSTANAIGSALSSAASAAGGAWSGLLAATDGSTASATISGSVPPIVSGLPGDLQAPVVAAAQQDFLGVQSWEWWAIGGCGALLLVVLLTGRHRRR